MQTHQVDGEDKDFDAKLVVLRVFSGSSENADDELHQKFAESGTFSLDNQSSVTLVFWTAKNASESNIEISYTIAAKGDNVGTPSIIGGSSLPLSSIAIITAIAALGTMLVLVSLRRVKLKR